MERNTSAGLLNLRDVVVNYDAFTIHELVNQNSGIMRQISLPFSTYIPELVHLAQGSNLLPNTQVPQSFPIKLIPEDVMLSLYQIQRSQIQLFQITELSSDSETSRLSHPN